MSRSTLARLAACLVGLSRGISAHADSLYGGDNAADSVLRYDATTGAFQGTFVASGSGGLDGPRGMVFGRDGNLYVVSQYPGTPIPGSVLRYNGAAGAFIDEFVPRGSGGLFAPRTLVFGRDGNLYVTESGEASTPRTGKVARYDGTTGAYLGDFVPNGVGGLTRARGMVFGPDGNLYVANYEPDGSILRYDEATGAFIGEFVKTGSGGLRFTEGITFGPDGNLYVAEFFDDNILRYDGTTGAFLGTFAAAGTGGLNGPEGLIFGPDGNLYVGSSQSGEVLRFDGRTGAFLDAFVPLGRGGLSVPFYLTFGFTDPTTLQYAVPEPGGLALLGLGALGLAAAWQRRKA